MCRNVLGRTEANHPEGTNLKGSPELNELIVFTIKTPCWLYDSFAEAEYGGSMVFGSSK